MAGPGGCGLCRRTVPDSETESVGVSEESVSLSPDVGERGLVAGRNSPGPTLTTPTDGSREISHRIHQPEEAFLSHEINTLCKREGAIQ